MTVQTSEPGAAGAAAALAQTQARIAEYGKYRAKGPIDIDGARAFNAGDPVPVQFVEGGVRMVSDTEYDPETGMFHVKTKANGEQVLRAESFAPIVDGDAVYEIGSADDPHMAKQPEILARPADNAKIETWREYAVQQGMDPDEALAIDDKAVFAGLYPKG